MYDTLESVRAKIAELKQWLPTYDLITALERLREHIPNPTDEMIDLINEELCKIKQRPQLS